MNLLGVNISHNCSIAFYKNKIISNLFEEERFNLKKKFAINAYPKAENFFLNCLDEKLNFNPDLVCYSSYGRKYTEDSQIIKKIQKQLNYPKFYFDEYNHHIHHACCVYYFSKFDEAMAIVIDGGGALSKNYLGYQEMESIFYINKTSILKKFQSMSNLRHCAVSSDILKYSDYVYKIFENGTEYLYSSEALGGYLFEKIGNKVDLKNEPGKIMGLASYSKTTEEFNLNKEKIEWCQKAQDSSFERTCWLIEKAFKYKKIKNFILSGGYFQNCSNNFAYVKKYPYFNFFVDPVPSDAGTAIGVCIYYENYL
jgi:predicted NodU family carbamoyl transferase